MKSAYAARGCKLPASRCNPTPWRCNRIIQWMTMSRKKRMRCIRMRGKKGEPHLDPADPPRRRANKQRGHGTYDNDRPPIVGTVGRETGKVRLRMVEHTDSQTLSAHVEHFTPENSQVYTDEWQGYNHLDRPHNTVC